MLMFWWFSFEEDFISLVLEILFPSEIPLPLISSNFELYSFSLLSSKLLWCQGCSFSSFCFEPSSIECFTLAFFEMSCFLLLWCSLAKSCLYSFLDLWEDLPYEEVRIMFELLCFYFFLKELRSMKNRFLLYFELLSMWFDILFSHHLTLKSVFWGIDRWPFWTHIQH